MLSMLLRRSAVLQEPGDPQHIRREKVRPEVDLGSAVMSLDLSDQPPVSGASVGPCPNMEPVGGFVPGACDPSVDLCKHFTLFPGILTCVYSRCGG